MDQTWNAWKSFLKPLQVALEYEYTAAPGQPDIFGTAAAEQQHHGIVHGVASRNTPHGIMEQLDSQFDALTSVATNSNAALEQITTTTKNQYVEIKASLNRLIDATPTDAATPATTSNRSALPLTEKN